MGAAFKNAKPLKSNPRSAARSGVFQGLFQKSLDAKDFSLGKGDTVVDGNFKPERLKIADLKIDERYQYAPEKEPGRVAKLTSWMAKRGGFDPAERGRIHVNRRANGEEYIMDGGGGTWMARKAGLTHIDAYVSDNWPWQSEAKFFLDKNMRLRTVKKPHLFFVAAQAGLEPHATIYRLLTEAGYRLETTKGSKGAIIAITALLFAWQLDLTGEILQKALLDMRHALGDQDQVDGRFLVALSVIRSMHPRIKTNDLRDCIKVDVFAKRKKGDEWPLLAPSVLLATARAAAAVLLSSRAPQPRDINPPLAQEILRRYNHRKETDNRLGWQIERVREQFTDKEQSKDVWSW
jgi:hypothetical protein